MRVKDLYIQIPPYDFSGNRRVEKFIGRDEVKERLKRRLWPCIRKNTAYKGAYLVAGYRGMGKSTLVDQVVEIINAEKGTEQNEKIGIMPIEVFLSQGNLSDYDLLRQMFVQLEANLHEKYKLGSLKRNLLQKAG